MLTISKPLSAGQARRYHAEEFQNARENYYTEAGVIRGVWYGQLSERWGLVGEVREDQFERLAEGQHPITGEQLVRHQTARDTRNARGEVVTTMEHRAGWDATFSAPKSVSITALVGGDMAVREAHRQSVRVALKELEAYVQARLGGNRSPETTGNAIAALFEHDSARPVNGYAAPQLHTHVVIFNVTERSDDTIRPLQPRELYRTQQYATAVYRSELAARLTALGYEIERGRSGQPEICGYSRGYLDASSPRRQQIETYLAEADRQGAAAAQIAAHQTREHKLDVSNEEMQRRHQELAEQFGNQPGQVIEAAEHRRAHSVEQEREQTDTARPAVTFARDRNLEREAVVEERAVLRDALQRSLGEARLEDIKREVDRRTERGEFVTVEQERGTPGRSFTTPAMMELERETIDRMRAGQGQHTELVTESTREAIAREYDRLNESQRGAVQQILANRDQVMALEGTAGAGKTTTLAAARDAAEREGYHVEGFAPTSRAAHKLAESGIESSTLQRHLARSEEQAPAKDHKRLYVLDESSLASTNEITGTDRQWAERYDVGDVVRYSHGSKTLGIQAGDYARVEHVDARENRLTVRTDEGNTVTYDPRRLQGVTLYRETERAFSTRDRVQMTAPDRERGVANRELGTIERIRENGRMEVRWDFGRTSSFEPSDRRHLDYGYAMTSHSSQGQTTGRVLVHVETDRASEKLVNQRLAYVAVSRGQHDARIYTDDKVKLARALNRDVSHQSALEHKSGSPASRHRVGEESRNKSVGHAVTISR